jgi:hypothetical protein
VCRAGAAATRRSKAPVDGRAKYPKPEEPSLPPKGAHTTPDERHPGQAVKWPLPGRRPRLRPGRAGSARQGEPRPAPIRGTTELSSGPASDPTRSRRRPRARGPVRRLQLSADQGGIHAGMCALSTRPTSTRDPAIATPDEKPGARRQPHDTHRRAFIRSAGAGSRGKAPARTLAGGRDSSPRLWPPGQAHQAARARRRPRGRPGMERSQAVFRPGRPRGGLRRAAGPRRPPGTGRSSPLGGELPPGSGLDQPRRGKTARPASRGAPASTRIRPARPAPPHLGRALAYRGRPAGSRGGNSQPTHRTGRSGNQPRHGAAKRSGMASGWTSSPPHAITRPSRRFPPARGNHFRAPAIPALGDRGGGRRARRCA